MSPDAAAVVAQVDATLLVAIAIEAKTLARPGQDEESPATPRPWITRIALTSILFSLLVTMASVKYGKPLEGPAVTVATSGVMLGVLPLFFAAADHARSKQLGPLLFYGVLLLGLIAWYLVWAADFAPGNSFWNW